MKKNVKKAVSLVLSSAMLLSAAACNSSTPSQATDAPPAQVDTQTNNTDTAPQDVQGPADVRGVWPIEGNPTLTLTLIQDPNVVEWDYGKNALTTWLTDNTGVNINFNFLPSSGASEKLNLELATNGELGDLIWGVQLNKTLQMTYGTQGIFAPLQDLVDNFTVNVAHQFETITGARELSTAPDGNIYALPYCGNAYNALRAERAWIHTEFLEKYGKGMPTTTDELYDFLTWVKENDVNGNGDPNDEIPWLSAKDGGVQEAMLTDFVMNAFTIKDNNHYYVDTNDKIHAAFAEDGWRKGLQYLNKAYADGLIDPSTFTNDSNSFKALVELNEGRTVAFAPAGGPNILANTEEVRKLYTDVPPLKGPDGVQFGYYGVFDMIPSQRYAIPSKSPNKEVAIRFLDYCWTYEGWMNFRRGPEGVTWVKPEEGLLNVKGTPALFRVIDDIWGKPSSMIWGNNLPGWAFVTSDDGAAKRSDEYDFEGIMYLAARNIDDYVIPCQVPQFFYPLDSFNDITQWSTEIGDVRTRAYAEFVVGTRDPFSDTDWNNYLKELENVGLSKYLQAQQDAFDPLWAGNYPHEYTKPAEFADERITND